MDTTPFHFILFALDIAVWGGLYLWIRRRRNTGGQTSAVYEFERSLYTSKSVRSPALLWDLSGVLLFGFLGLSAFAFLARLIHTDFWQQNVYFFNVGQCIAEGIAVHGTLFFAVSGGLLYRNRRKNTAVILGMCGCVLAMICFDALYWEPYHIRLEHYKIKSEKIKQQIRIVFVADIQTDRIGFHEINTLKTIQQQKADLIILGGDYIQTFQSTREKNLPEKFRQMLIEHPLEAPLGVYTLEGNIRGHGGEGDNALFSETGIEFVQESFVYDNLGIDKNLGPIDLILLGLDHSRGGLEEQALTDSGNFIVMAGHYPNYAIDGYTGSQGVHLTGYRETERAPDLMLAGHTHGGQVVLPFYGPVPFGGDKHAAQIPRKMRGGFFTYQNGGKVLITRGSGLERGWAPRIRFFCPAEVSVIDLIPQK